MFIIEIIVVTEIGNINTFMINICFNIVWYSYYVYKIYLNYQINKSLNKGWKNIVQWHCQFYLGQTAGELGLGCRVGKAKTRKPWVPSMSTNIFDFSQESIRTGAGRVIELLLNLVVRQDWWIGSFSSELEPER